MKECCVYSLRCSGCGLRPIKGPCFRCKVCKFFNFCRKCFQRGRSHTHHNFQRINSNGQQGVDVGQPKSKSKEKRKKGGHRRQPGDELARDFVLLNMEEVQEVCVCVCMCACVCVCVCVCVCLHVCVCVCEREKERLDVYIMHLCKYVCDSTLGVYCMCLCMSRSGSINSS